MSDATKILQTGVGDTGDGSTYPTPVIIVDADGNPVDVGAGQAVEAPTADTLAGATATGRAVLKATDAAAARKAIGAGVSSFSGSYNDLTNKPTIPTVPAAPTWATISGKPAAAAAIADVATDGTVTPAAFNALLAACRAFGIIAK